jgi:hypothetical protein
MSGFTVALTLAWVIDDQLAAVNPNRRDHLSRSVDRMGML